MSYKILVSGNAKFGIAKELDKIYPDANFASRSTGFATKNDQQKQRNEK